VKINISRQHIYLLSLSLSLFIFVLIFAFAVLIPEGKAYRIQRTELKKDSKELYNYQNFHDDTQETLQKLKSDNRHVINAFGASFDAKRFEAQHKSYFTDLNVLKATSIKDEEDFTAYEVNTTSKISSPTSFYDFLDAVNKSDWIIDINFPINFKRDAEIIKSSFTMKVYSNKKEDSNATASESVDK
jgi:hypothetical protein